MSPEEFHDNAINTREGHLGGYVESSDQPAPSGLDVSRGDPATWHPALWLWAISTLNVRSVLDVGCGEGHSTAFFKDYGCRVLGVDGSREAHRNSRVPDAHHCHDFTLGPFDPGADFDMAWCCEFVEHVEERYVDNFLRCLRRATRFIFLTHALPGQPGWHHVNCREPDYWIRVFVREGYRPCSVLTRLARKLAGGGHFANSGMVLLNARATPAWPCPPARSFATSHEPRDPASRDRRRTCSATQG